MDAVNHNSRIERAVVILLGSQIALYFLGLGPVISLIISTVLLALWLIDFAVEKEISLAPLNLIWGVASVLLLLITVINYYQSGSGGTYMIRWMFSFFTASICLLVGGQINSNVIQKAMRLLGIQVLVLMVVFIVLSILGMDVHYRSWLPNWLNVLPEEYFFIHISEVGRDSLPRAVGFTPYATYGGFVGVAGLFCSGFEIDKKLSWLGSFGWLSLLLCSLARTSYLAGLIALGVIIFLFMPFKIRMILAAIVCFVISFYVEEVFSIVRDTHHFIDSLRPGSSMVRNELGSLGYGEWRYGGELLLGGGSTIEAGAVVKGMPVGTHGTVYSTLLIRGCIGLLIIVVAFFLLVVESFRYPRNSMRNSAIACIVIIIFSSISENIEALCQYGWFTFLYIGSLTHKQHETHLS